MAGRFSRFLSLLTVCALALAAGRADAQVYAHDFGTAAISSHPYTVAPSVLDSHLSNSSWSNSTGTWTSAAGSSGQAIRLTTATNATVTLTFNVAANFALNITGFSFWSQRSNAGPASWAISVNGAPMGSGITGTTGADTGVLAAAISGLTGSVNVTLALPAGTGNGTYRIDDFTLYGTVVSTCSGSTVTSVWPSSGPQHTLVTISGSGFLSGTGTSAVTFNGIPAVFTVVSDSVITAYIPAGNATGALSVITNGCPAPAGNVTVLTSASAPVYSSDIYITELYDAQTGDGGVIEIYNGTNAPVNLAGYTIRRYGTIGGGTFGTITLSGIIPPGGIFLIGIGTGVVPCGITEAMHYAVGFNDNDEFVLYNGTTIIDDVQTPNNVGYSMIRNPDAVSPNPIFTPADWTTNLTEDCTDIGMYTPATTPPQVAASPASATSCENGNATFSTSLPNPAGYTFQWKMLDAAGNWVSVPATAPFSGANTATLSLSAIPAALDQQQFYCEMVSGGNVVVSPAAQLTVTPGTVPNFPTSQTICSGSTAPVLATTSPNGISGTWSPATVSNTSSGNYVFTPNAGQCAAPVTFAVTVTSSLVPNFPTAQTICSGSTSPILAATSPNGISGTWSPATVSNTSSGNYVFTPNAGQCAAPVTFAVTVTSSVVPNFPTAQTICSGSTAPILATTSPNGISGTWSPATVSNTSSGNYVFTPNAGQCAAPVTFAVTVTSSVVPNFPTAQTICSGSTAPTLSTTSPNGISGTWSPATVSNTASGNYVFTPNAGQCASPVTFAVTVTSSLVPNFPTAQTICWGSTSPILATTSPNGISGTWSPATVSNTANGNYVFTPNAGQCAAPVTFAVTVTSSVVPNFPTAQTICSGSTAPILAATSPNGITGTWSPSIVSNTASGNYVFTPNAGQCASPVTFAVTVTSSVVPNFPTAQTICSGSTAPILAATSPNGITGTWSPSIVSNTASGNYVFTPNAGQCASPVTFAVTVTSPVVPNFPTAQTICSGAAVPVLATTSPNGITGTWSPATVSNTSSGNYVFTPNAGQCASPVTFAVTVTSSIVPNFPTAQTICSGSTAPILAATSPNGITGTWSPSIVSNTASGNYVFTPNAGQCASPVTFAVTVTSSVVPNFPTAQTICSGSTAPVLATTSPNGISGTWSPATVSNTASGNYVFTPNAGQCASPVTLAIAVTSSIVPNFPTAQTICSGAAVPVLATTSPNGISGTWSAATVSNTASGNYVFTPNAGQCASPVTFAVTVTSSIVPNFPTAQTICSGSTSPILATTSPNGITGTWSPSIVSNTASGNYVFTPNAGQCASPVTFAVTVTSSIVPNFPTAQTICSGSTSPILATTSPNGITGTWSPSIVSNTASGNYVFTPNAGQCASPVTFAVTVTSSVVPNFPTAQTICSGSTAPVLATTSPNGIIGTWSPATVSNTASGNYVFTPDAGQCAAPVTFHVTVAPLPHPMLSDATICLDENGQVVSAAILDTGLSGSTYQFSWTRDGNALPDTGGFISATVAGQYEVLAVDMATGCSASAQADVTDLSGITGALQAPRDFEIGVATVSVSGGSGHYLFEVDGELHGSSGIFPGLQSGAHHITVNDASGCGALEFDFFLLNYPRFFTPNADGFNDLWDISGLENQPARISVFDRYGKLLKTFRPSISHGWDGTYNGYALPSTDYWFVLDYTDRNGKPQTFKSHFSLKR